MTTSELKKKFHWLYKGPEKNIHVFFAPGRVNLIGEHTDYNGGLVLPFALQYGTYLVVRKTPEKVIKFHSANFPFSTDVSLNEKIVPIDRQWVNYPLGVIAEFGKLGQLNEGMEMLFYGDIPNEAGLSSSASIEMVTAFAMNELYDFKLSTLDLVKMSQKAENDFVGMNCGIMDQFAVGMGKKDRAVYLNCETLDYDLVPFNLSGYVIVIANTNKKRGLADSKYNERRSECETALKNINKEKAIANLSELTIDQFKNLQSLIEDEVILKRAKHVISENFRVQKAINALKENDLVEFGKHMINSHDSLRDDYAVSCKELDILVEESLQVEDVLGSRMTGAGFGGCTISLVPIHQIETFQEQVGRKYFERTNKVADFYIAKAGLGIRKIDH